MRSGKHGASLELETFVTGEPKTMGERFLWARLNMQWNQRQAAAVAGVSCAVLTQYERDRSVPSLVRATRLAAAYGVSLAWLATGAAEIHTSIPEVFAE